MGKYIIYYCTVRDRKHGLQKNKNRIWERFKQNLENKMAFIGPYTWDGFRVSEIQANNM